MKKSTSNVQKLILFKVSRDAIPDGAGFKEAVTFLSSKDQIVETYKKAEGWVKSAIQAVRNAKEPNPYKNTSDEEIAEEIFKKIEKRD